MKEEYKSTFICDYTEEEVKQNLKALEDWIGKKFNCSCKITDERTEEDKRKFLKN